MGEISNTVSNSLILALDQPDTNFDPGGLYTTTHPQYYYDVPCMSVVVPFASDTKYESSYKCTYADVNGYLYVAAATSNAIQIFKYKPESTTPVANVSAPVSFYNNNGKVNILHVYDDNVYWITEAPNSDGIGNALYRTDMKTSENTRYNIGIGKLNYAINYVDIDEQTLTPIHVYTTMDGNSSGLFKIHIQNQTTQKLISTTIRDCRVYKHYALIYGTNNYAYMIDLKNKDQTYAFNVKTWQGSLNSMRNIVNGVLNPLWYCQTSNYKFFYVVFDMTQEYDTWADRFRTVTTVTPSIERTPDKYDVVSCYAGTVLHNKMFLFNNNTNNRYWGQVGVKNDELRCYVKHSLPPRFRDTGFSGINGGFVLFSSDDSNPRIEYRTVVPNTDVYPYCDMDQLNVASYLYTTLK